MRKIQLDEQAVIAMYEHVGNARDVAAAFNVSDETIYRILRRHNIKRTYRHPKPEPKVRKSHCSSKYCPALIVMLCKAYGWNARQIAEATGYTQNGTRNILARRGLITPRRLQRVSKPNLDLDKIEREYLAGATTYSLGEKYCVNSRTISKWMRQRGIHLGKGAHQEGRTRSDGEFVYSERMREINRMKHKDGERRFVRRLAEAQGGRFEYVGGFRDGGRPVATVRCMTCGHEFVHGITDIDKKNWRCPCCVEERKRRQEQEREVQRYERMFAELREYALDKTCACCGKTFHSAFDNAKYCSKTCARKARGSKRIRFQKQSGHRHYYHVKYGDRYLEHYDPSVTLRTLYKRDGGVCQICGNPCDWDDKEWGTHGPTYPSIDHIVPRAQGGDHFWSNVQLTHCICNSYKRDLSNDVACEMVMSDVAIAY